MGKINSKKQLREFGLLVGIGFPLVFGWIIPIITGHEIRIWTIWLGSPIVFLGIFFPYHLNSLYKIWMSLGHALGWINSKIILGLVFFLVLQPLAIIMKVFGYDPLRVKRLNRSSYKQNKNDNKVDLNRIF